MKFNKMRIFQCFKKQTVPYVLVSKGKFDILTSLGIRMYVHVVQSRSVILHKYVFR